MLSNYPSDITEMKQVDSFLRELGSMENNYQFAIVILRY